MLKPPIPAKEEERLKRLQAYEILDTLPEQDFDDITRIASHICQKPIALVSLIDEHRQWFKSHHGLDVEETPRDYAFCAHAINHPDEVFVVNDANKNERFQGNPLVEGEPKVIFYAGAPLVSPEGHALGTLCVIDHQPGDLNKEQQQALQALARQVMGQLELRRKIRELDETQKSLEESNQALGDFAHVVSHDLQGPLRNISLLLDWLEDEYGAALDEQGKQYLELLKERSGTLSKFVKGVLDYSMVQNQIVEKKEAIDIEKLYEETLDFLGCPFEKIELKSDFSLKTIYCNRAVLQQIMLNLISNGIKYNDKAIGKIGVSFKQSEGRAVLTVQDNGLGIPANQKETVFNIFHTLGEKDRFGNTGNGIGLHTVKKLVDKIGGEIQFESEVGEGTTFKVYLPLN